MSGLDPRYIVTSDIDTYYVDKDTGYPLSGGIVNFYSQTNQSVRKSVYQITSVNQNNFKYTALPNPCYLSSSGTFQDALGNNIVPYYFPYDDNGNLELYYITVYSSGGVLQLTRVGWPNEVISEGETAGDINNFIPNGQFLAHNNIVSAAQPPSYNVTFGAVTLVYQPIAQGGWNFIRSQGGTSTFANNFVEAPALGFGLPDFPRYAFNFQCTSYSPTDAVRDLSIEWPNVFTFSSGNGAAYPPGSQPYTLYFAGNSNDTNNYVFTVHIMYNFGTGGTPSQSFDFPLPNGTFTLRPGAFQQFNITIPGFNPNGVIVGSNNDDYISINIRGPAGQWNVYLTDFALVYGVQILTQFPVDTNANMLSEGVAGWMPTPDPSGMDLYLPLILTTDGMTFDNSIVGTIVGKTQVNPAITELPMNGAAYVMSAYNTVSGIPYARLGNFLIANSPAITMPVTGSTLTAGTYPLFGTGPSYVTAFINATPAMFDIQMNTTAVGNSVTAGTSGFTVPGSNPANQLWVITVPAVPTAGAFFTFSPVTPAPLTYNVWYSVDGAGAVPPTPTGANIQVKLVTTPMADDIASTIAKTVNAINQYQFMIINAAGYFWRGLDPSALIDRLANSRIIPGITDGANVARGPFLGSLESDTVGPHTHPYIGTIQNYCAGGGSSTYNTTGGGLGSNTASNTGLETAPKNLALNWFIKY